MLVNVLLKMLLHKCGNYLERFQHLAAGDVLLVLCVHAHGLDSHAAKRTGAVAPAAHFPHALLDSAERVFKATAAASMRPNKMQQEVALRLWELGVVHDAQHITPDGLFMVDIAIQDCKVWPPCAHQPGGS